VGSAASTALPTAYFSLITIAPQGKGDRQALAGASLDRLPRTATVERSCAQLPNPDVELVIHGPQCANAMFERGNVFPDVVIRIRLAVLLSTLNERVAVARIESASEKRPIRAVKSSDGDGLPLTASAQGKRTCGPSSAG
jgi:hypothetical protein